MLTPWRWLLNLRLCRDLFGGMRPRPVGNSGHSDTSYIFHATGHDEHDGKLEKMIRIC